MAVQGSFILENDLLRGVQPRGLQRPPLCHEGGMLLQKDVERREFRGGELLIHASEHVVLVIA
jgi:hypothetical protein